MADVGGFWLAFSNLGLAGLAVAPFALAADWGPPDASWWWLLVLGLGITAILLPLSLVVLDHLPASTVGVLMYLEPLSALVLAWIVLSEDPTPLVLVGGALIVAGGVIVLRQSTVAPGTEVMARVPG